MNNGFIKNALTLGVLLPLSACLFGQSTDQPKKAATTNSKTSAAPTTPLVTTGTASTDRPASTNDQQVIIDLSRELNSQCLTQACLIELGYKQNSPIGSNLSSVVSWDPDWVFVDQFVKARTWIAGGCQTGVWDTGRAMTYDSLGWVTSAPSGICPRTFFLDSNGKVPGTYVLYWEGEGSVELAGASSSVTPACEGLATCRVTKPGNALVSTGPGPHRATFVVNATNTDGVTLQIPNFNSTRYIKNFRAIIPGGVCGTSQTQLNYMKECRTARGGSGSCGSGETCYDFDTVHFNRFSDSISAMNNPKVVFHPRSLSLLRRYKALRFMDWLLTNHSTNANWATRTRLASHPQNGEGSQPSGIALEYVFSLSNLLGAHPWINVPHMATDDYVRQMAGLTRSLLRPSLKVYVEYSNEVWNGMFSQATYAAQQGRALSSNSYEGQMRFFSQRTVEIMNIWSSVFGAETSSRVVRVMGGWAGNSWTNELVLSYNDAYRSVDALAIAPYFGGYLGAETQVAQWNLNTLFSEISSGGHVAAQTKPVLIEASDWIKENAALAARFRVSLLAYEGGQHLVGFYGNENIDGMTNLFIAANRDVRMGDLYTQYLGLWKDAGGQLFMNFSHMYSPCKWGSWGVLETVNQTQIESPSRRTQAPKFDALMSYIERNSCWWNACSQ